MSTLQFFCRLAQNVLKSDLRRVCVSSKISGRSVSQGPIGFIGLGNMGNHMARNLLEKGHCVVVHDVYPESVAQLVDRGALTADSPAEIADQCNRIITMLPSSLHVQEVYVGENGIFQQVKPGTFLIDSSTIDPTVTRDLAAMAEKRSTVFLDAPVSGGVNAAKDAKLTFMVGGKEGEFQAAREILLCMGNNVVHCGEVGTGQAAKICNNMAAAISMIGVAESMNLGIRLGLEPKMMSKILNMSSGRSWASEVYNPVPGVMENVPAMNNYSGGFVTALMAKDLGLAQSAAMKTSSPIPLGSLAYQIYRMMVNSGFSQKDFSSVYLFLQENQSVNENK